MPKEKIKKSVEEKKSEWMGIAGFVLGFIFLSGLPILASLPNILLLLIVGILIVGFILCIKQREIKSTKLAIIGLIINIITGLLYLWMSISIYD